MKISSLKCDIEGLAREFEVELKDILPLYERYFEEMQTEISEMGHFLLETDWLMLERIVHNIKGVSANLGVNDVLMEAEKFDIMLKNHEIENAAAYVERIIELIKAAETNIRLFFRDKGLTI